MPRSALVPCLLLVCACTAAEDEAFRLFARPLFEPILPETAPAPAEAAPAALRIAAAPDEFETAALAVRASRPLEGLRVSCGELKGPGGAAIPKESLRVSRILPAKVKTGKKDQPAERLVPEWVVPSDVAPQSLEADRSACFWITVRVPADAAPGRYSGEISVEAKDAKPRTVALELDVRPFKLEPSPITFAMLYTYEFRFLERYDPISPKRRPESEREAFVVRGKAVVRDLAEHGMNAIFPHSCMGGTSALLRKDGKLFLPDLEMSLRAAKEFGMLRAPGFYVGQLVNAQYKEARNFDAKRDGETLRELSKRAAEIARAEGFKDILIVPSDEPDDPDNVKLPVAEKLLAAAKGIDGVRLAVTSGGNHKNSLRILAELHQVSIFAGGTPDSDWAEAVRSGREAWLYENNASTGHNPLWSRYVFGYFGWRGGFQGVSAWTYPLHAYAPYEPERKREDAGGNAVPEFDKAGHPINTVVWEAIREGVDDRRYLETLRVLAAKAKADGKIGPAEEAQKLLVELHAGVSLNFAEYGYAHNEYGEPLPGKRDAAWFGSARERIAAAIIRLKEAMNSK